MSCPRGVQRDTDVGAEPGECSQLKGRRNEKAGKGNRSHIFHRLNGKAHVRGPGCSSFQRVLFLLLLDRPDP